MLSDERRSISSYSLIVVGSFWLVFGTSAGISQGSSASYGGFVLILKVLFPPPGAVVYTADFTWNIVGALLLLSGILSYIYTREKAVRYPRVRTAAIIVASIVFFYGLLALSGGILDHYVYCYLPGARAPGGPDCSGSIFTFTPVVYGILYASIGSISFVGVTITNLSIARRSSNQRRVDIQG